MAEILIVRLLALVGAAVMAYYVYRKLTKQVREERASLRQMKQVIEASRDFGGRVTATDLALTMEIPSREVEASLSKLAEEGLASVDVGEGGSLVYDIPRARVQVESVQSRRLGRE
jgi:hypothetical protein